MARRGVAERTRLSVGARLPVGARLSVNAGLLVVAGLDILSLDSTIRAWPSITDHDDFMSQHKTTLLAR